MITYTIYKSDYKKAEFRVQCLSTDTKPVDSIEGIKIKNGSKLYEINTGKKYMYDEEGGQWCEILSSGGSSGGSDGGASDPSVVFVQSSNWYRPDDIRVPGKVEATFNQIKAWFEAGKMIVINDTYTTQYTTYNCARSTVTKISTFSNGKGSVQFAKFEDQGYTMKYISITYSDLDEIYIDDSAPTS